MKLSDIKSLVTLGRQPSIGIAELEALFGADHVLPFGDHACLLDVAAEAVDFTRLGGSVRLCSLLTSTPGTDWKRIADYLTDRFPSLVQQHSGKLTIGLSAVGLMVNVKQIEKTALSLKKLLKSSGHSVRIVPNKQQELNSAQIIHNKLTAQNGWEIVAVTDGSTTLIARTYAVQDIEAYAARDQARPARDAKVGMLPPKLAQTIVNLAAAQSPTNDETIILDPFCGTGVILQEASLMGFGVFGTDINPRMVEYSIQNMQWLRGNFPEKAGYLRIELADATKHIWKPVPSIVAGETFLGQPLAALPASEHLRKIIYDANLINHQFLLNIAPQLPTGTRLCMAVPVWRGKHEFLHLPLLDHLTDMGYTRLRFKHVTDDQLIYYRENQVVGRELLVLEKN